jgi:hypothetical protein
LLSDLRKSLSAFSSVLSIPATRTRGHGSPGVPAGAGCAGRASGITETKTGIGTFNNREQVDATGMTMPETLDIAALRSVIRDAKEIARRYRNLTGRPLGITGEVGEFTAAELMSLRLTGARQPGYNY